MDAKKLLQSLMLEAETLCCVVVSFEAQRVNKLAPTMTEVRQENRWSETKWYETSIAIYTPLNKHIKFEIKFKFYVSKSRTLIKITRRQ